MKVPRYWLKGSPFVRCPSQREVMWRWLANRMPVKRCLVCGAWYWAGRPKTAKWSNYCSQACDDHDCEWLQQMIGGPP